MPREKKKRDLTQSVLFIAIFWALVALLFVGIIHLLQRIDLTGFIYSLLK